LTWLEVFIQLLIVVIHYALCYCRRCLSVSVEEFQYLVGRWLCPPRQECRLVYLHSVDLLTCSVRVPDSCDHISYTCTWQVQERERERETERPVVNYTWPEACLNSVVILVLIHNLCCRFLWLGYIC